MSLMELGVSKYSAAGLTDMPEEPTEIMSFMSGMIQQSSTPIAWEDLELTPEAKANIDWANKARLLGGSKEKRDHYDFLGWQERCHACT